MITGEIIMLLVTEAWVLAAVASSGSIRSNFLPALANQKKSVSASDSHQGLSTQSNKYGCPTLSMSVCAYSMITEYMSLHCICFTDANI